jgi:glutamyl-tRNA reductase
VAEILLVGVNYKKAALDTRERLVFRPDQVIAGLENLAGLVGPAELALLSTCNRTEIYICAENSRNAEAAVKQFLARRSGLSVCELDEILYVHNGYEACLHLLQVACGLDSLVIGENEIQGQVRDAFELAQSAGKTGPILSALFRAATTAGKRARSGTEIGRARLSVAAVVVRLAEQRLGSLTDKTALLIGAGKISSATARALKNAGLHCILLANRNYERACKLAESLKGEAVHFDELEQRLPEADIVICSTSAPHIVLHAASVALALAARPDRPLLVVDLAVPRDADPSIACLPGAYLVDIDGLQTLAETLYPLTLQARQDAGRIISEELDRFEEWRSARQIAPLIQALQQKAGEIAERQAELTLRRLGEDLTPEQRRSIEAMGHAIVSQLLHAPITHLKSAAASPAADPSAASYHHLVEDLFGL